MHVEIAGFSLSVGVSFFLYRNHLSVMVMVPKSNQAGMQCQTHYIYSHFRSQAQLYFLTIFSACFKSFVCVMHAALFLRLSCHQCSFQFTHVVNFYFVAFSNERNLMLFLQTKSHLNKILRFQKSRRMLIVVIEVRVHASVLHLT